MQFQQQTRSRSVYVSRETAWALRIIAAARKGDDVLRPETTMDGIAEAILREGIDRDYPGLVDTFQKREAIDAEGVKLAIATLDKEKAA